MMRNPAFRMRNIYLTLSPYPQKLSGIHPNMNICPAILSFLAFIPRQHSMRIECYITMMNTRKSPSVVANMARSNGLVFSVILLISLIAAPQTQAADIFATPTPRDTTSIPYPTKESFLAATKTGEIPLLLIDDHTDTVKVAPFNRSIGAILLNQYGITTDGFRRSDTLDSCWNLFKFISKYEIEGPDTKKGKEAATYFQTTRTWFIDMMPPKALEALDSLIKEYSKAVKAYLVLKQDQAEQRQVAAEKVKQKEVASERQAQLERDKKKDLGKQQKAIEDARNASLAAEEATKAEAIKDARDAQEKDRATKLQEFMQSPPYKLWQASLKVVAGLQMIQKAQNVLNHDNAVTRESDVSNLTERRAAGEDIVAGKRLVEKAFADYKRLGGPSATPEEVVPGPDPAAQYR
jgi:hypothetical protein